MKTSFKDLIVYEIYPTSFYDSNGDGTGDLPGIAAKLDYIQDLGFNALWINPFYVSPFRDGGYDVADFFDVDPRFGTLEDFRGLIAQAHAREMKVFLDLVAGHASVDNREFRRSAEAERNEFSDLFIWNGSVWDLEPGYRLISGMYPRHGCYLVNFFAHQPAFNYGFNKVEYPWQMTYQDERTQQARNYILDVMRFWLAQGADGFRVDMADSLVKNDEGKQATIAVWQEMFSVIRKEYPDVFFVSEWSDPAQALKAGFDADFVLDHWDNFYHRLVRSTENTRGVSVFNGGGDMAYTLRDMQYRFREAEKYGACLSLISGNHDSPRIADFLTEDRLRMFYLALMSLPGIPFVLYGDELGMRTADLPSKDGGYQRTGTRIPMVWDDTEPHHGFSQTAGQTYLPYCDINRVSVQSACADESSLYHYIRKLIRLRKDTEALRDPHTDITEENRVLRFTRGKDLELVLNLSDTAVPVYGEVIAASREITDVLPPYTGALVRKP